MPLSSTSLPRTAIPRPTRAGALPVVVVVGPTASGKTALAVRLAARFNGEIVSADSRQVYRGMDIGTGKDIAVYGRQAQSEKRKAKSKLVPYHLIGIVSPRTQFTVKQYQRRAYRAIEDILRRGKLPIICGGTGLYVDAVVQGYQLPELGITNYELRMIRRRLDRLSLPKLLERLARVDPETYQAIDRKNQRRVQRAMEIYYATRRPKSARLSKKAPPYQFLQLGLRMPRLALAARIKRRLNARLNDGLVAEVRRLHRRGVSWRRLESFGLEYRWVSRYARGLVDRSTMEQRLLRENKDFARRQMTWFRRNPKIVWVSSLPEARRTAADFIHAR